MIGITFAHDFTSINLLSLMFQEQYQSIICPNIWTVQNCEQDREQCVLQNTTAACALKNYARRDNYSLLCRIVISK